MTIYTRWGDEIEITANCGQHQPKGFRAPVTLVRVKSDRERYQFAEFLKASSGWQEIEAATKKAPANTLNQDTLKNAIREAL